MADALASAQRDKEALAAMFAKEKEALQARHAEEVKRLQDRIAELEAMLARLKAELDEANATTFYYEKVRRELDAALQLPIGKTVSRIQEIIEELGVFQARSLASRALPLPSFSDASFC
jgi:uncharacterized protein involved in exopolysaccharide biosynthesis